MTNTSETASDKLVEFFCMSPQVIPPMRADKSALGGIPAAAHQYCEALRMASGFGWYVFAGAGGRAVARDITLDGNTWRDSRSVKLRPFIGLADAGVALLAYGARLSYTHVVETQDFKKQKGGLHQFGSLALSVRF